MDHLNTNAGFDVHLGFLRTRLEEVRELLRNGSPTAALDLVELTLDRSSEVLIDQLAGIVERDAATQRRKDADRALILKYFELP